MFKTNTAATQLRVFCNKKLNTMYHHLWCILAVTCICSQYLRSKLLSIKRTNITGTVHIFPPNND